MQVVLLQHVKLPRHGVEHVGGRLEVENGAAVNAFLGRHSDRQFGVPNLRGDCARHFGPRIIELDIANFEWFGGFHLAGVRVAIVRGNRDDVAPFAPVRLAPIGLQRAARPGRVVAVGLLD